MSGSIPPGGKNTSTGGGGGGGGGGGATSGTQGTTTNTIPPGPSRGNSDQVGFVLYQGLGFVGLTTATARYVGTLGSSSGLNIFLFLRYFVVS